MNNRKIRLDMYCEYKDNLNISDLEDKTCLSIYIFMKKDFRKIVLFR